MMREITITALLTMCFVYGSAQVMESLTIEQAISTMLENNYNIRIAERQADIDANNVTPGNAGMLPVLDVTATQSYTINNPKQEFVSGDVNDRTNARSNAFTSGVILDWTIFDGLKMFTTYDKLEEMQELGMLQMRREIETQVEAVMDQYYNLVNIEEHIRFQDSSIAFSQERYEIAQRGRELGTRSKVDMLQAKVDLNADSSALLTLLEQKEEGLVNLNRLMGVDAAGTYDIDGSINVEDTMVYAELRNRISNQNIDLRMGQIDQSISQKEVQELRQERWPTLSLNSGYNYDRSASEAGFLLSNRVYGWSYGITARWNLFDGWNQQRRIENATIQQDISRLEYENTRQHVMGDLEVAYKRYTMALRKLKLEEENRGVAAESMRLAQERFELGNLSGLEYREIQQQYYGSQTRYLDAQYQALLYQLELKRLSGEIVGP